MTNKVPRWTWLIATGMGSGLLSPAPGTWGSFAGLLIWCLLTKALLTPVANWLIINSFCQYLPYYIFIVEMLIIVGIAIVTWLAVFVSDTIVQATKETDPSYIVIDEWVGLWIALWPVRWDLASYVRTYESYGWTYLLLMTLIPFISFRFLDIWKPWPIRQIQVLPDGQGIVADDIVAGLYSVPIVILAKELLTVFYNI